MQKGKKGKRAVTVHGVVLAPACKTPSTTVAVRVDDHTQAARSRPREARDVLGPA